VAIVVTGVLSGLGPAVRAERLQVIEALRSE
jgi:ABC-type antimicrobial peptide transport system permease subunit